MGQLENKKIIIVGGGGLLGSAICDVAVAEGAHCIIADASVDRAENLANDLNKRRGIRPEVVEVDINNKNSVVRLIDHVHEKNGKIDGLVNTAYPKNKNYGRKFENVEYEDFCENINLHLGGYFLVSQQILEYYKGNKIPGSLINISSMYGYRAPKFEIYEGTKMTMPVEYAAIKSAINHLTRYMAVYYKGLGIKVNAVSPGGLLDGQPESFVAHYNKLCINKGMLNPHDIAGTVVFLLSDAAGFINGQNIIVDDGWVL